MKPLPFAAALLLAAFTTTLFAQNTPTPQPAPKYNVLFIISDDLRTEPTAWRGRAITPNIDKLASEGMRFDRAYCQYPLCNPSRASMLTGRNPGDTGVLGNRTWFGEAHPDFVSLPKYFKQNGYATLRSGKIFHEGIDDTDAWSVGGEPRTLAGGADGDPNIPASPPTTRRGRGNRANAPQADAAPAGAEPGAQILPSVNPRSGRAPSPEDRLLPQAQRSDRWLVMPGNGESDGDYQKTTRAIELLREYKDRPFFMGFGLSKPHSPPGAPQKFYDLYSLDRIELPVDFEPRPTVPEGFPRGAIRPRNADLFIGRDASPQEAKEVIRAYLASTSYVDSNVGRILEALDTLGLREKTIIVFWGDHGYQLGEKGKWSKAGSLFEQGARTPFVVLAPGMKGNGQATPRVVEALDFYPTLVELCGLPAPAGLQGRSLVPLLKEPQAAWDHPAFTVWSEDGRTFTGVAVRTERWRYAEFTLGGPLLIDLENDPHELKNVANDPQNASVVGQLSKLVADYRAQHGPPQ
jgi:arylsulfatase A-like enzyme